MQSADKVTRGQGDVKFGLTDKERERMDILLQEKTYSDGARRLGITEAAMKQTMARIAFRYSKAKSFCNRFEEWKVKRRKAKRSKPSYAGKAYNTNNA